MKFATYRDGSRDGQLLVVSRDLSQAHYATGIANRLQQVLDDWGFLSPQLQDLYTSLNQGRARHAFPFDPTQCMAPLPRAYQWVQAEAYPRPGAAASQQGATAPGFVHASGDAFWGATDTPDGLRPGHDLDFQASLAVVCADLPCAGTPEQALQAVRLLLLTQTLVETGAPHSARTACSPVAVTPDELGESWQQGRVHLRLQCAWNGRTVGLCDAASDMAPDFGQLLARLCQTRELRAGTLLGVGPVRERAPDAQGQASWSKGYSSIADKRALELWQDGQAVTPFLSAGDRLSVDMKGRDGRSLCGAIQLTLEALP